MNTWFFIAMLAPLLWSVVNHIDKYLLTRYATYAQTGTVGSLLVFSSLVGLPVMAVVYALKPDVTDIPLNGALILFIAGILGAIFTLLYLYAMIQDEASVVMPFFQTIPIFGMVLGFVLLGEKLSGLQMLASLVIFAGAALLSVDWEGRQFKRKLVAFVLSASFFFALQQVLFKMGAITGESFLTALFWMHAGLLFAGIMLLIFVESYRREFIVRVKSNSKAIFGLNLGNETLTIAGNTLVGYASLLAPVALVMTVELYQPVFVLALGILLAKFAPHISSENIGGRHLAVKIASIAIIFAGSMLLYSVS